MSRLSISHDPHHFVEWLDKGVILRDGEANVIDVAKGADAVWVAIVVDVEGYGPHEGAIYVDQNRYHASADTALQEAYELLENYKREHMTKKERKELEKEWGERADEIMTETFSAMIWKLDPVEFGKAIKGTKAAKFIETYDSSKD